MKRINYNIIDVPLEFKVACTVYRQSIQEVLQIFIDHVSMYDSLTGEYSKGFSEATMSISSYTRVKVKKNKRSKAFLQCRDLAVSCINSIFHETRNPKGTTEAKRKKSRYFVNALYQIMERPHTPSVILYLDENSPNTLTKDFCVICELQNCYPKEFLEYFMGRVSIADVQARSGLKFKEQNFPFDFFLEVARGFGRPATEGSDLTDMQIEFYQRMEELSLEIYNVRDLQERTAILRDFYLTYHQNMNQS
jgi:hypothetical protein